MLRLISRGASHCLNHWEGVSVLVTRGRESLLWVLRSTSAGQACAFAGCGVADFVGISPPFDSTSPREAPAAVFLPG